jgi:hypothetical protein
MNEIRKSAEEHKREYFESQNEYEKYLDGIEDINDRLHQLKEKTKNLNCNN